MRNRFYVLLGFVLFLSHATNGIGAPAQTTRRFARIQAAVADLRREPTPSLATLERDPLEESQLLYGDLVEILEEKGDWARVSAMDQPEWSHHRHWEGYPGWVEGGHLTSAPEEWIPNLAVIAKLGTVREKPTSEAPARLTFSLGTKLVGVTQANPQGQGSWWKLSLLDGTVGWIQAKEVRPLVSEAEDPATIRNRLVQTARLLLGDPYYWGGRSAYNPDALSSPHAAIDCSGLVGLVYQANGLYIPRDAHEQWMLAQPIDPEQLSAGDLIFLYDPENPKRISHVMLYAGQGTIIEAPGTGRPVREMGLRDRLKEAPRRRLAFGTYLR